MIQRIQSIFLLLASGASFGLFGLPLAETEEAVASSSLFEDRVFNIMDNPALIGLFTAGGALSLIAIFLFRNRSLQMRLAIFALIANLLGILLGVIFFMQNSDAVGNAEVSDGVGMYLPVLALILNFLAYRYINKDEKTVRSMDRLR